MNKTIFLFFFCCCLALEASTICLNMIVKNEKHVIERCLASVKPFIDYWVIVDTGSSDGTQSVIKEFMKDIPGELHEKPWVNFEHNRNEALKFAQGKSDYILFIDADDMLSIDPNFTKKPLQKDAYYLKIEYGGTSYQRIQLIKDHSDYSWVGVVHEVLISETPKSSEVLNGVTMKIIGGGDRSKDTQKSLKDAAILEKALEKNPSSGRNVFYLAQSYRDAGKFEDALKNYQKRVAMGGWDQEVFCSKYQIGLMQEELQASEEVIRSSYMSAYQYRPVRIEPLYRLAAYYRKKENHLLCYLISKYALKNKAPDDVLFVESWIYDYGLLFEFSVSAYWVEDYRESQKACKLLLNNPNLPKNIRDRVDKNLMFVEEKLSNSL